jgi:hypothetical protein
MQRNGQKRDKKSRWKKTTGKQFFFSLNFFGQKLLTWNAQGFFVALFGERA